MLVLTRRIGEEILIDGNIRLTLVAIRGTQVRLGVTAPSSVRVARMELCANWPEATGVTADGSRALQSSIDS
jgi:carbon storage regulator